MIYLQEMFLDNTSHHSSDILPLITPKECLRNEVKGMHDTSEEHFATVIWRSDVNLNHSVHY